MRELVDLLVRSRIPLLIIGGHALGMHGAQRDTVDLDCVLVAEKREEMKAFLESRGFEEAAHQGSFSRFRHQSLVYPLLDVMQVDAETWEELWAKSLPKTLRGLPMRVPAVVHLVALKLHAIRENPERERQDGEDIARLLRANPNSLPENELRVLFERYQQSELFAKVNPSL